MIIPMLFRRAAFTRLALAGLGLAALLAAVSTGTSVAASGLWPPTLEVTSEAAGVAPAQQAPPPAQSPGSLPPTMTGEGRWSFSHGRERVHLTWTGAFRLSEDDSTIVWVEPGASVLITDGAWWLKTGIEVLAGDDGTLERHHFRRGFERDWDPGGQQYLASSLQFLVRRAGLGADTRVARLLAQGGPAAVHAAIETLETDSARRRYYAALIEQADLDAQGIVALVDRASATFDSDSYRRTLLRTAAARVADDEAALRQLIGTTVQLRSDSYQRSALVEIMPAQLTPGVAAAVLAALPHIESNSYRAAVLEAVVARGGLTEATSEAFFMLTTGMTSSSYQSRVLRAVTSLPDVPEAILNATVAASTAVSSDSEQRRVLSAALADRPLTPDSARTVLTAMSTVGSPSYRAALLEEFAEQGALTDANAGAFFPLVASMSSSSYQRRVMEAVLARPELTPGVFTAWLRAVPAVGSDSELSRLLLAALQHQPLTAAHRELYLQAAETIDSNSYQTRVLAELVRTERGG